MEKKRVIRGNNTVFPTGAEILGQYATNAVTDKSRLGKGNIPISNEQCVIEARLFSEDKKV